MLLIHTHLQIFVLWEHCDFVSLHFYDFTLEMNQLSLCNLNKISGSKIVARLSGWLYTH